jgi:hypothetical protein
MHFTGHNPSAPINATATNGGYSFYPECPSVTTTVANTMIVRIGAFDDDDVFTDFSGLFDHTTITMDQSGSGNGTCSGGAGYKNQTSIGSSGTSYFLLSDWYGEEYRTVTLAITPFVSTGGTVSGGAGYTMQSTSGDSGTSNFSLDSSNEARTLTIAIAPENEPGSSGGGGINP